tara:strand:+ start:54 stop:845 length:792 start_codon:yes stop_codon:yes gene_type:complete
MIPFLRRKKEGPIFLDCYTSSHYAYNHAKIDHARKYIPEWWKREPAYLEGDKVTIKHCSAFTDYYATGIVIPLWGEVEITVHPLGERDGTFSWVSSNLDFDLHSTAHGKAQWEGFGNDNLTNIKFVSPWILKTREVVQFAWSQPTWSQPDTFNGLTALPGVMQFKTQGATNINYVVESKAETQTFNLQPLTPLAIMHPMTERKVEIRHHFVTEEKLEHIGRRGGGMLLGAGEADVLHGSSATLRKKKAAFWKKADELNKCPFK